MSNNNFNYAPAEQSNQRLGEHYQRYARQQYSSSNQNDFTSNHYENVYDKNYNIPLSVKQEPEIEYTRVEYYLTVSSRDRDRTVYPSVNRYVIQLPREFRNIASIELIQAIIPDKNNVTHEPYLLLMIDEIKDVMISSDKAMSESFAVLQLTSPLVGFIQLDKRIHENTVKEFRTPMAGLSKMSISLKKYDGTLFNFGNDSSPPTPHDIDFQNTFVFKIICLEKSRTNLNQRNVY